MNKNLDSRFTMFAYVREFLTSYIPEVKNYSESTAALYRFTLNLYFDYIADVKGIGYKKMDFDVLNKQDVKNFMLYRKKEHECTPRTCNTYLTVVRSFMHYCVMRDNTLYKIESDIRCIPRMKEETDLTVRYFSKDALKAILEVPDRNTEKGRRNFLIMFLLYDTGCRISELLGLTVNAFYNDGSKSYIQVCGKGNKTRNVPICKLSVKLLNAYIEEIGYSKLYNRFIFFGRDVYSPLSTKAGELMIKKIGLLAHENCSEVPEPLTPHMFRHSRAMHLYEDGVPLTTIKQFLGHSSIDTTYIYAYASVEMKRKAIDKATNENNMLNKMKIKAQATSPLKSLDKFKEYFGLKNPKY